MSSLSSSTFGSPEWFSNLAIKFPDRVPQRPSFVVEHREMASQEVATCHQQLFEDGEMAAWVPEKLVADPDLILIRPRNLDAGDLLGRISPAQVLLETSVVLKGHSQTCALGITDIERPGLEEVAIGVVDLGLEMLSTPFGDAEIAIRLHSDGSQELLDRSKAHCEVTMRLAWPALIEWIHTDTRLGYLMTRGNVEVDGSIMRLSYIEGHIAWPRSPEGQQLSSKFLRAMETYQQLRLSPAYVELMDLVEEADTP